jgi:hypothetical protein
MMQRGESTDWWTPSFWWYLKLSTFNGRTIVVSSLISLIILGYSLFYLCESLRSKHFTNSLALLIVFCSPLYGGFGVNISHDTFIAAGLIIFTGYHIRIFHGQNLERKLDYLPIINSNRPFSTGYLKTIAFLGQYKNCEYNMVCILL